MFTGLVEKTGKLISLEKGVDGARITVAHDSWDTSLDDGESIAVQGACLTVTGSTDGKFVCDVLAETLDKTNLTDKKAGDVLNLERALRVGDRLGGHIVSGHVDSIGTLQAKKDTGRDVVLQIRCDAETANGIVLKGSISIDGISLTVTAVSKDSFEVNVIPFTIANTSLNDLNVGGTVNLETDVMGKYVMKQIAQQEGHELTMDDLRNAGFM